MRLIFKPQAEEDLQFWNKSGNRKALKRISTLLKAIEQDAHHGIGKPEPLKYDYSGWWSRRIDQEHRLVYKVENVCIIIAQCRLHYR